MDPYKVLGVTPQTSDDDVKRAYRELARKYHPDNYVTIRWQIWPKPA